MPPRARAPRRPRRRVNRMRRMRRGGLIAPRAQLKPYNYVFRLPSQIIQSSSTVAAQVYLSGVGTTGQTPITNAQIANAASQIGSANYCDWTFATSHALTDCKQVSLYTTMYDAYKINSVNVEFEYLSNTASVAGSGIMPTFYMYWDQDDAATPGNLNTILAKAGVHKFHPTAMKSKYSFTYKPLILPATFVGLTGGGIQYAAIPAKSTWLNCTADSIPHVGLKCYVVDFAAPGLSTVINAVRVNFKYNVSFRSPLAEN